MTYRTCPCCGANLDPGEKCDCQIGGEESMQFTDDPVLDAERFEAEQKERLDRLPLCECCGKPIQQEKAVYYNGQYVCESCEDQFWSDIREDFLEPIEC